MPEVFTLPLSARQILTGTSRSIAHVVDATGDLSVVDRAGGYQRWTLPDGFRARHVCAAPDGAVWLVASAADGGPSLFCRGPGRSVFDVVRTEAPLARIAAGIDGTMWAVTLRGEVLSWRGDRPHRWHSPRGVRFASEISAGLDGSVWIVGAEARHGGYELQRLAHEDGTWADLPPPASGVRVAVGPDGMAWGVNEHKALWRIHPAGAGNLAECRADPACSECRLSRSNQAVLDVAVGPDGGVWVVAEDGRGETVLGWLADARDRVYRLLPVPHRPIQVSAGLAACG